MSFLTCSSILRFKWRRIKQNLNNADYKFIYPLVVAKIYGTPKMHKLTDSDSFPKFRPIFPSVGTFNYNLSEYLYNLFSVIINKMGLWCYSFSLFRTEDVDLFIHEKCPG